MTISEFQQEIRQGIPATLPEMPQYDPDINHAPRRKDILTVEQKRLALRNALRYFPREKVASLSGTRWLEFLDHTGLCHLSRTVSDWDSMAYGGHILTRSERRSLYRQGFLWLCSNVWRRP